MDAPIELLHQNTLLSKTKTEIHIAVTEGGAEERDSIFSQTLIYRFQRKGKVIVVAGHPIIEGTVVDLTDMNVEREVSYSSEQELINNFGAFIGKFTWGDLVFNAKPQDKE